MTFPLGAYFILVLVFKEIHLILMGKEREMMRQKGVFHKTIVAIICFLMMASGFLIGRVSADGGKDAITQSNGGHDDAGS